MTIFDDEYWEEMYQERAAIMEHDGGKTREEAEEYARGYVEQEKMRLQLEMSE